VLDDENWSDPELGGEQPPEEKYDPVVEEASDELMKFFDARPEDVFYEKQIEIFFERKYFHWITTKALKELRELKKIESNLQALENVGNLRFYFHRHNRYWRRKAAEVKRLVRQFSAPEFTAALGQQGELHIDAGLPTVGFLPQGMNVREFGGRAWKKTDHNLDRVFERDGSSTVPK